jgi:hypothetical protein
VQQLKNKVDEQQKQIEVLTAGLQKVSAQFTPSPSLADRTEQARTAKSFKYSLK